MLNRKTQQVGKRKTLRYQIYTTIGLTFICIAVIYSLILFPFEKQRRGTVIKKIELSIDAIFAQRENMIANEMFLKHHEAVEPLLDQMLAIDGILVIEVFNPDGSLFVTTERTEVATLPESERKRLASDYLFVEDTWNRQPVATYTKAIIVIGELLGYVKIYYALADVVQETRLTFMIFSMLLLTVFLAMAVLLNLFLSRSIVRPVSLLIHTMRKVQHGEVGEQVRLDSENEIGEMAQTFNQLSAKMVRMYRELDDLNKHLERKVKERTKELHHKNVALHNTLESLKTTQKQLLERTRQLEAARTEAEFAKNRAEAASQAKSEFLSHISHELRTPLNGIMGYAHILRQNKGLSTLQQDGLNVISQCGHHLLTLINDILDLSKIEAHKLELAPATFYLPTFLEGIMSIIHIKAHRKGIHCVCVTDKNLPSGLYADEKRLRQILLNLLGNAVNFTEQGSITLRITNCDVRNPKSEIRHLKFEIEDTGIGIAPEHLEKIFLPFEQVGENVRRAAGTGLGLTISRRMAELMGSTIQVKSELGKGSVFWFDLKLPVSEMAAELPQLPKSPIIGYLGPRRIILVADDSGFNRALLINLLEPLGFDCIAAKDGHEVIIKARETHPDIILIDLVMPIIPGLEAVQELRQIQELQATPIIAVSASISEEHQQESFVAGCDGFLCKPLDADKLFELLKIHLRIEWICEDLETGKVNGAEQIAGALSSASELMPPPPATEMKILFDLAMMGDMRRLQERALYLEGQDDTLRPFARKLYQLAKDFQDKQVLGLIEQYMEVKI